MSIVYTLKDLRINKKIKARPPQFGSTEKSTVTHDKGNRVEPAIQER